MRAIAAFAAVAGLCGCSTTLTMNVYTNPPGAMVVEGSRTIGKAPLQVQYKPTPEFDSGGCMVLNPLHARWWSGAETQPVQLRVCAAQTYLQNYTFLRPDTPGIEEDLAYAANAAVEAEHAAANAAAAAAQRAENAAALGQAIGCAAWGCGSAPQPSPRPRYSGPNLQTAPQVAVDPGCYSDINCTYGMVCLKTAAEARGRCATPVNQHGIQQFGNTHHPVSCTFSTDCGVGFDCQKNTPTALTGFCVKR
jgi:hypothetical protein